MTAWPAPSTSSTAADQRRGQGAGVDRRDDHVLGPVHDQRRRRVGAGRRLLGARARRPSRPPGRAASAGASAARAAATTSPNWRSISAASGGREEQRDQPARLLARGAGVVGELGPDLGRAGTAAAPPGSEEISASALTRCGARSASRWATKPPIDQPTTGSVPDPLGVEQRLHVGGHRLDRQLGVAQRHGRRCRGCRGGAPGGGDRARRGRSGPSRRRWRRSR